MAELIDFGAFSVNFLQDKHGTKGALDMFELTLKPEGRMPMPHYHEAWEESVYGVSGTVTYTIGGVDHHLGPGDEVFVPRNVVHGFDNRTNDVAKCLCILTPGVLGPEYFRELAEQVRTGKPDPAVMREIMMRHRLIPAPNG
ncbi:MAG: cupin domain-containing protein [Alphaproteobacteria bacterium]